VYTDYHNLIRGSRDEALLRRAVDDRWLVGPDLYRAAVSRIRPESHVISIVDWDRYGQP